MTVTALRDTLERSGILRDDPLHQYLVVLGETLEEDRVARAALTGKMCQVVEQLQRYQRVASSIHMPAPWRRHGWVWAVALVSAFMVGAASGGWAGHAVAGSAYHARSNLDEWNDLGMLAQRCDGSVVSVVRGRRVCQTAIWLDPPK